MNEDVDITHVLRPVMIATKAPNDPEKYIIFFTVELEFVISFNSDEMAARKIQYWWMSVKNRRLFGLLKSAICCAVSLSTYINWPMYKHDIGFHLNELQVVLVQYFQA